MKSKSITLKMEVLQTFQVREDVSVEQINAMIADDTKHYMGRPFVPVRFPQPGLAQWTVSIQPQR